VKPKENEMAEKGKNALLIEPGNPRLSTYKKKAMSEEFFINKLW